MGLDVSTNRDYYRFNWSGVSHFREWNERHGMPNCWENWNGDNDETLKYKDNKDTWEAWVKAFEEKFPDRAKWGVAQSIQFAAYDAAALYDDSHHYETFDNKEKKQDRWYMIMAHGWYWLLKQAINDKSDVEMG